MFYLNCINRTHTHTHPERETVCVCARIRGLPVFYSCVRFTVPISECVCVVSGVCVGGERSTCLTGEGVREGRSGGDDGTENDSVTFVTSLAPHAPTDICRRTSAPPPPEKSTPGHVDPHRVMTRQSGQHRIRNWFSCSARTRQVSCVRGAADQFQGELFSNSNKTIFFPPQSDTSGGHHNLSSSPSCRNHPTSPFKVCTVMLPLTTRGSQVIGHIIVIIIFTVNSKCQREQRDKHTK